MRIRPRSSTLQVYREPKIAAEVFNIFLGKRSLTNLVP